MAKKRSVSSGVISFGLVSIPVKFYISAMQDSIKFCQLTKNGKRVKQFLREEGTGEEVQRSEVLKGYEIAKGQYVQFTSAEIKSLEETDKGSIEIKQFVPADSVDLLHVEKSYHIGPDKGGDKPYNLLSLALTKENKYAVAQWTSRGKQHLVVIRPYEGGLVVHQMFYADEVREFDTDAATTQCSDTEVDMACQLIGSLSVDKYDVAQYEDSYKTKVLKAVEQKSQGEEITVAPNSPTSDVGDLMAALQASLGNKAA